MENNPSQLFIHNFTYNILIKIRRGPYFIVPIYFTMTIYFKVIFYILILIMSFS